MTNTQKLHENSNHTTISTLAYTNPAQLFQLLQFTTIWLKNSSKCFFTYFTHFITSALYSPLIYQSFRFFRRSIV